ncbi:MAG TPA: ABC transporter permease [Jiangellaceae bacterium]|nr:ABC transporter permease [Jiangellaceae bacterium]
MGPDREAVVTLLNELASFLSDPANWSGPNGIPVRVLQHLVYTALALAGAFLIAFPVGLLIGHTGRGAYIAINLGNAARAIPTFGVLILAVMLAGIGLVPVLVALIILGVPPILTSTYAGIRSVDGSTVLAARGMGMTELELLRGVELPIALPTVIAGVRSATLQIVSTATLAAYVALGGLGRYVIDGLAQRDYGKMASGAVLVAILAILLDFMLVAVGRVAVSPGVSGRVRRTSVTSSAPTPTQSRTHPA